MQAQAPLTALLVAVALLAGCLGDDAAPAATGGEDAPDGPVLVSNLDAARVPPDARSFTGSVKSEGIGYGSTDFTMDVPEGAAGVHALLEWEDDANLALLLVSPDGDLVKGTTEMQGHAAVTTTTPPAPGAWTVRVTSPHADEREFAVTAWAALAVEESRVDERVELRAGEFLEVNVILAAGTDLQWAFEADAPVVFDVHSHDGSRVVKHAEGEEKTRGGAFTAPADGTYSLFITPKESPVVLVDYALKGAFRVHSRVVS